MEEIGRRLQAARLTKGLTLQDVEEQTRIRKKYLEALESGRTANIPGDVYVKGFLRTYGNLLGLDGEALVGEYKQAIAPAREPAPQPQRPRTASPPPRTAEAEEQPPRRSVTPRPRKNTAGMPSTFMIRRAVVTLVVIVPLAGLGWWLFGLSASKPKSPPPVTPKQEPAVKPADTAPKQPDPQPAKPVVTMTGVKEKNKLGFTVSATPAVVQLEGFREGFPWIQVRVDGKEVFEGRLTGPVKYEGKEVVIYAGFTDGVDLVINGEKFAEPIKSGPNTITVTGK